MVMTAKRWLLGAMGGLAALLLTGIGAWGCDDDPIWEHPNRERYPAPPAEDDMVMSLDELQREWAREDRRTGQLEGVQAQSQQQRRVVSATLNLAALHVRRAVDTAADRTRRVAPPVEGEPVGGGPPSEDASDDASGNHRIRNDTPTNQ